LPEAFRDGGSTVAAIRNAIRKHDELRATFLKLEHEFFEEVIISGGLVEKRRIARARRI
jgi:hypothetical protein